MASPMLSWAPGCTENPVSRSPDYVVLQAHGAAANPDLCVEHDVEARSGITRRLIAGEGHERRQVGYGCAAEVVLPEVSLEAEAGSVCDIDIPRHRDTLPGRGTATP
jgi:hypothetical protein